jgi:hypothetical protein
MNGLKLGCVLLLFSGMTLWGDGPPGASVDGPLRQLRDPDPEKRVAALRELLTSLDPRIPRAMLPLLDDEGNSIRRLAGRAVGSRWWQIPAEDVEIYQKALKRNAASELADERNMARRAQGLLSRKYLGDMFGCSADKRWVVYERHGYPCLIDTKSGSEELLGWNPGDSAALVSSWGNGATAESVLWHPSKSIVAFSMLLSRKASAVWVWKEGRPLRKLSLKEILSAVGPKDPFEPTGGCFVDDLKWDGDELFFEVSYTTVKGDDYADGTSVLAWDGVRDRLRLVEREKKAN